MQPNLLYLLNERFGEFADNGRQKAAHDFARKYHGNCCWRCRRASAQLLQWSRIFFPGSMVLCLPSQAHKTNSDGVKFRQGMPVVSSASKSLIDYVTYANLYQPCAALAFKMHQVLQIWISLQQIVAKS